MGVHPGQTWLSIGQEHRENGLLLDLRTAILKPESSI